MYRIFTFREFKSIHKGKTAILHLRFGTEKNRRLGSKKARYNRAFRKRHLFCLHILARKEGFEPSRGFWPPTPLAGEPLRPLGYFRRYGYLAERVGFEPTDAFTSPVFKTGAFNRSAISPDNEFTSNSQTQELYYHIEVLFVNIKYENFHRISCWINSEILDSDIRSVCSVLPTPLLNSIHRIVMRYVNHFTLSNQKE